MIIKVYEVKIQPAVENRSVWYQKHAGCIFKCYLWCKHSLDGYRPVFRMCEVIEGILYQSVTFLDIRPADCFVISEENVKSNVDLYTNK